MTLIWIITSFSNVGGFLKTSAILALLIASSDTFHERAHVRWYVYVYNLPRFSHGIDHWFNVNVQVTEYVPNYDLCNITTYQGSLMA